MATVRHDVLAVFVGPSYSSGDYTPENIKQLKRVQSSNYSIDIQRDSSLSLGTANDNNNSALPSFVNLDINYLISDGENENTLGFITDGKHGFLSNINTGERDLFILINDESQPITVGIGNCLVTNYSVNGNVGGILNASVSLLGENIQADNGISGVLIPRVNLSGLQSYNYSYELPPISNEIKSRIEGFVEDNIYIGQKDIKINFLNNSAFAMLLSGEGSSYCQSFSISANLVREELTKIGEKYPFNRSLHLPIEVTLSADFVLSKFVSDKIQNYFSQNESDIEINLLSNKKNLKNEFWQEDDSHVKMTYVLRGLKLKNFSTSDVINDRKKVTLSWTLKIGNIFDVNKNMFISGNFGRYRFPVKSFRDIIEDESIIDYGLQPIEKEVVFERKKIDSDFPDFDLKFKSNLDIHYGDPDSLIFYDGNLDIESISGVFGEELVQNNFIWNSDSYSTIFYNLPNSGYSQAYEGFLPHYQTGTPYLTDGLTSGSYYFYIQGDGFNAEQINVSFVKKPTWMDIYQDDVSITVNPYKPFYFSKFAIGINDLSVPTGTPFEMYAIANNSKLKKIYKLSGMTPYSNHIIAPSIYRNRFNLWIDPYDETSISVDSNDNVNYIKDKSIIDLTLSGISGQHNYPTREYKKLNNKSYITFESGSYLLYSGSSNKDFRRFTLFTLISGNENSNNNCEIIKIDNAIGGINSGAFNITRDSSSENIRFSYKNISGSQQSDYILNNGFIYNNWNLNTIYYDGNSVSARINGQPVVSGISMNLDSGNFARISVGSGLNGGVAEVILTPYCFSSEEMSGVENYLRYKWGV